MNSEVIPLLTPTWFTQPHAWMGNGMVNSRVFDDVAPLLAFPTTQ